MTYGSTGRWMAERLSTSATASDNEQQHMSQHQLPPHRHQRHPHYGADEDDDLDDQYNPSGIIASPIRF